MATTKATRQSKANRKAILAAIRKLGTGASGAAVVAELHLPPNARHFRDMEMAGLIKWCSDGPDRNGHWTVTEKGQDEFVATHVIQTGCRRWYVHAEQAEEGGQILYTEEEWEAGGNADWELQDDGSLTFKGSTSDPVCQGVSIQPFADCRWTRADGWADDGTRMAESAARRAP